MSIDEVVKLLDALTRLVSTLAWPLLTAYLLVRFVPALRDFSSRSASSR